MIIIIILIMGIKQWTFNKVALLVHCFQVELEFGKLAFVEEGKLENVEKNPPCWERNQQQTQPTCDTRLGNPTWATAVGGKHY